MRPLAVLTVALAVAAVAILTMLGAVAIVGRAADDTFANHVIITRDGITLDCERITDVAGRTFYDSCERVP